MGPRQVGRCEDGGGCHLREPLCPPEVDLVEILRHRKTGGEGVAVFRVGLSVTVVVVVVW